MMPLGVGQHQPRDTGVHRWVAKVSQKYHLLPFICLGLIFSSQGYSLGINALMFHFSLIMFISSSTQIVKAVNSEIVVFIFIGLGFNIVSYTKAAQ